MATDYVPNISSDWIHSLETEEHWRLYWHQAKLIENNIAPGDTVLEIGIGSGFLANWMRTKGINVTTLDVDANKKPDIVADITKYFLEDHFDHLLAFEVLEHIPFNLLQNFANSFLPRIRKSFCWSVPFCRWHIARLELRLPKLQHSIIIPVWLPKLKPTEASHHWEINSNVSLEDLRAVLSADNRFRAKVIQNVFGRYHYELMLRHHA